MSANGKNAIWSTSERDWLVANYTTLGVADCAAKLNRTRYGVKRMVKLLHLRYSREQLSVRYRRARRAIAAAHGCRTYGAFLTQRRRLRYGHQWPGCGTKSEVRICQTLHAQGPMTAQQLADALGLKDKSTPQLVCRQLLKDGILTCKKCDTRNTLLYSLAPRRRANHRREGGEEE